MDLLKQRLTDLWMRQPTSPMPESDEHGEFPHCMGVTFKKPMDISGTKLSPGRYIFRLLDSGAAGGRDLEHERHGVQFFHADRTKPFAELAPVVEN